MFRDGLPERFWKKELCIYIIKRHFSVRKQQLANNRTSTTIAAGKSILKEEKKLIENFQFQIICHFDVFAFQRNAALVETETKC